MASPTPETNSNDSREFPAFHHLLLSAFPVLGVYANNIGAVPAHEIMLALTVSLGFALATWIGLYSFMRDWKRAALGTSWIIICLLVFSHGVVQSAAERLGGPQWFWFAVVGTWLACSAGGVLWLSRQRQDIKKMTGLLTMFSLVLICGPLLIIAHAWSTSSALYRQTPAHISELSQTKLAPSGPPRDVYYLVFDRYADEETLRHDFGYDNRPFLEALRERGFFVAEQSRANYCKTDVSMASALNMSYHSDVMELKQHYANLLHAHVVGRLFKQQGYKYYHYGNLLDGIRSSGIADHNYRFSTMPTEFSESVLRTTALCHFFPPKGVRVQEHEKFRLLEECATDGQAKFVYAHFLLPHGPWKFDRDGTPLLPQVAATRTEQENYVRQLEFTNDRILHAIDAILQCSATPPIIIIQADEGPELKYENDPEKTRAERMRKRLGILSAFYLPERDAKSIVPVDISPVNTFRLVFREYFSAELPLLANRSYYWDPDPENTYGKPEMNQQRRQTYRLVNVTEQIDGCYTTEP